MKVFFYFVLFPFLTYSQVQIGSDLNGEAIDDNSGYNVSISNNGNIVAVGAIWNDGNGSKSGHVRVYQNNSSIWSQIGSDINGEAIDDHSGYSICLSNDGNIIAIGAPYNNNVNGSDSGHVRIYRNISNVWTQIGSDINGEASNDLSGYSLSLSNNGNVMAVGAPNNDGNGNNSGHVRVYQNNLDVWTQIGSDINGESAGDLFGLNVSLSDNGNIIAIGGPYNDGNGSDSGHVRIYRNNLGSWTQIGSDINGESFGDRSGWYVSLSNDGNIVAIGAIDNNGNGTSSGHVRIYQNISNVWSQVGSDINGEAIADLSGLSISLSGDGNIIAISANRNDENGSDSGHVRIYQYISNIWTQIGTDINGEAAGDWFGSNISLSNNGSVVIVGANRNDGNGIDSGHARIFDLSAILNTINNIILDFNIFPNPVSEVLTIQLPDNIEFNKATIYNTLGQIIKVENSKIFSVKDLTNTTYFIEVETNKGKATKIFIKE